MPLPVKARTSVLALLRREGARNLLRRAWDGWLFFWRHFRAEIVEGAATFFRWWRRTVAVGVGFYLLLAVFALGDPKVSIADGALFLIAFPVYGAFQGAVAGIGVGATAIVLRLVGWALVVPLALVPACIFLAFWLGDSLVVSAGKGLIAAIGDRFDEIGHMPIARAGHPIVLVVVLPVVLAKFFTSGAIWLAAAWFLAVVGVLLILGASAGTVLSTPPLAIAFVRRLIRRARERDGREQQP